MHVPYQFVSKLVSLESKIQRRFDESKLLADIVSGSDIFVCENILGPRQCADRVRQLNLSARSRLLIAKDIENGGRQYVPTHDRHIGWRMSKIGFLNQPPDPVHPFAFRYAVNNAVTRHFLSGDPLDSDDGRLQFIEQIHHLPKGGRTIGLDDVIAK